jgi:uncharacterized protein (DUF111 family)
VTLERSSRELKSSLGQVTVKVFEYNGRLLRVAPEYEECRRIAMERGLPLLEVYRIIEREAAPQ